MSIRQPWRWSAVASAVALSLLLVLPAGVVTAGSDPADEASLATLAEPDVEARHGGGHDDDDDDRDGGREAKKRPVKPVLDCVIERAPGRFVAVAIRAAEASTVAATCCDTLADWTSFVSKVSVWALHRTSIDSATALLAISLRRVSPSCLRRWSRCP